MLSENVLDWNLSCNTGECDLCKSPVFIHTYCNDSTIIFWPRKRFLGEARYKLRERRRSESSRAKRPMRLLLLTYTWPLERLRGRVAHQRSFKSLRKYRSCHFFFSSMNSKNFYNKICLGKSRYSISILFKKYNYLKIKKKTKLETICN